MTIDLSTGIVRIYVDGQHTGMGFLTHRHQIVTCSHVLSGPSDASLFADFPFVDRDRKFQVRHLVDFSDQGADLSVVQLDDAPPISTTPLDLFCAEDLWGHSFRVFGCPEGHPDGVWSSGTIRASQASRLVIIEAQSPLGYAVGPGFSGSPVWDEEIRGVVGMVVAAERNQAVRTGFMLPASVLVESWATLELSAFRPSAKRRPGKHETDGPPFLLLDILVVGTPEVAIEQSALVDLLERLNFDPLLKDTLRVRCFTWPPAARHSTTMAEDQFQDLDRYDLILGICWGFLPSDESLLSRTSIDRLFFSTPSNLNDARFLLVKRAKLVLDPDDPGLDERIAKYRELRAMLEKPADLPPHLQVAQFTTVADLADQCDRLVKENLRVRLAHRQAPSEWEAVSATAPQWEGSPFPGLRPFGPEERQIFYGREDEVAELLTMIDNESDFYFLPIVGSSGSGKSSLMGAGVLGSIFMSAVPGGIDWPSLTFAPADVSDDPFIPIALALQRLGHGSGRVRNILEAIKASEEGLAEEVERILESRPRGARFIIFIDQLEELFTVAQPALADQLLKSLHLLEALSRVTIVATLRADFFHRCLANPFLARWCRQTYTLTIPSPEQLCRMIELPAAKAGLVFEQGLPQTIVADAANSPGSLPLVAYTLDELYRSSRGGRSLDHDTYEALGGVLGAIGRRAEAAVARLEGRSKEALRGLFSFLVEVPDVGSPSKRRVALDRAAPNHLARRLVDALVDARLLVTSVSDGGTPMLELAHEALIEHWAELSAWTHDQQRQKKRILPVDEQDHMSEMARRRKLAIERTADGAVFEDEATRDDGTYCWVRISDQLYRRHLADAHWSGGRAPGLRSPRVRISGSEALPVIFRLRGLEPRELASAVRQGDLVIAEFWPNSAAEGFRGVTFVSSANAAWRQDLVPSSAKVFNLSVRHGRLWLTLVRKS